MADRRSRFFGAPGLRAWAGWLLSGAVLVGLLSVLAVVGPGWLTQTTKTALFPHPQPYTELFFTDQRTLPDTYRGGDTVNLEFTIVNAEQTPVRYSYQVAVTKEPSGTPTPARDGQANLTDGEETQLTVPVTLTGATGPLTLTVDLSYTDRAGQPRQLTITRHLVESP